MHRKSGKIYPIRRCNSNGDTGECMMRTAVAGCGSRTFSLAGESFSPRFDPVLAVWWRVLVNLVVYYGPGRLCGPRAIKCQSTSAGFHSLWAAATHPGRRVRMPPMFKFVVDLLSPHASFKAQMSSST